MASTVYGPVLSRRLGYSLGIDLFNGKTCTINCVYCQLGSSAPLPPVRKRFVDPETVKSDIREAVEKAEDRIDYITFSGCGEPTLSSDIGEIIDFAKSLRAGPICVLTNGTLLSHPQVRKEISNANLVIPNLDAGSAKAFQEVNRPHEDIDFENYVEGIIEFSKSFKGDLFLEVVLVRGINDSEENIRNIADIAKEIDPDGIWIGTITRPPGAGDVKPVSEEKLDLARKIIGEKSRIIETFKGATHQKFYNDINSEILSLIKRRPETIGNITMTLGINKNQTIKSVGYLLEKEIIKTTMIGSKRFYELDN